MAKDSKKVSNIVIIIGIIVALGAGTFGGAYYFMSKKNANQPVYIQEAYVEIGEIFVNLSDENSKRYAKLNLSISYDSSNKDLANEIAKKQVAIKDTAVFYFKSLYAKDFEPANEAVLKGDLVARINKQLNSGLLIDVYISEIIVQ